MAGPVVLIVTGPPGSGKSTAAKLVAQRFARAACVESDWFWTTIVKGFVAPWRAEADAQNRAVLGAMAETVAALATAGYAVVVDGIVGPWHLGLVSEPLARRGVETHYTVLRPALAVTQARVISRARGERASGLLAAAFADEDPVAHMWEQFSALGDLEDHVVDNARLDPEQTAALVWSRYRAGTDRL
ncbi:MAG TPA: AAA family ATPase [Acidimicrobiales bacterium]|nr:AAA family ATPase [Acidimicrobiales bacterium]